MKVVFLEDVSGVANGGEVKEVKNGFARNYLIPQNLAIPVSHNALKRIERLSKEANQVRIKTLATVKALGEEIDGMRVNIQMRAGANGKLYGSVNSNMLVEKLLEMTGHKIDRRIVLMDEPIRDLGQFSIKLRLHPGVESKINVIVHAEDVDPASLEDVATANEDADEHESVVDENS
jgi:large subunit ribosomal protein L9